MSFVVLTDITGASCAINPALVQGITVASGVTPAACFVRTATEAFVIAGTPTTVAAALAAGAGAIIASIKSSDGSILAQNAAAIAAGLAVTHNGAGDNTVTLTDSPAVALADLIVGLTAYDKESVTLGTAAWISGGASSIQVLGWDAAGVADDVNFLIYLLPS